MTGGAKVELDGVAVRRGAFTLHVPSLALRPGEVLAVIGPNGSGKSTLLHVAALLERPEAGVVRFEGRDTRGAERHYRRRMAVVFQEPLLLNRSVRANVSLGLRLRGAGRRERREREDRWLATFGVLALADRPAPALSGGEAQRVNLARAFALQPEVLLLDEPFAALDAPTREALTEELGRVLASTGVPALLVTHDRGEALRLGDRIAVLIDGRIRQIGTPHDVFAAPADPEVAAFVGVETILPGRVVAQSSGVATVELSAPHHGVVEAGIERPSSPEVLVCLRPEDVTLAAPTKGAATSARNQFACRVLRVSAFGMQTRVELDCGPSAGSGQGFPLVALVTQRSALDMGIAEGTAMTASFKASAVHLIPKGDG